MSARVVVKCGYIDLSIKGAVLLGREIPLKVILTLEHTKKNSALNQ